MLRQQRTNVDMNEQEDFIQRVKTDAYNAATAHLWADAWAMGYEAAKKDLNAHAGPGPIRDDHPLYDALVKLDSSSFVDLRRRAYDEMTDKKAQAEREFISAMADLGRTSLAVSDARPYG